MNDELQKEGVVLYDRQSVETISLNDLQRILDIAVAAREEMAQKEGSVLSGLDGIEITLIDDPSIARVHQEFFDDPSATDVITFEHGEILVSVETARRQAKKFDSEFLKEIGLYAIHGLAHLAGYDDKNESDRAEMHSVQEDLLERLW